MKLSYYTNRAYQSDFRSKFPTETTSNDVTEYIINSFYSGELIGAVMLDLKKHLTQWTRKSLQKNYSGLIFNKQHMPLSIMVWKLFNGQKADSPINCHVQQGRILL